MKLTMNIGELGSLFPIEELCRMIACAGFDSIDYSLQCLTKPENPFCGENYLDVAKEIKRTVLECGISISQTHAPFSFAKFSDPDVYREFIYPSIVRSVEISGALGADTVVVHPLHHMLYEGHEEEIFRLNMEFYRSLIPVAKNSGIKIAVENMWQRDPRRRYITHDTCSTIAEFCRYIDTLDSPYIVACLDVGHVGLPLQRDEAWDFIYALGHDRLKALHIHDNDYKMDNHLLPYTGMIDWTQVTKALGAIDYDGDFTYEIDFPSLVNSDSPELVSMGLNYAAQIGRYLVSQVEKYRTRN